ncbi:hypothetical protein JL101_029570 (plasmid) [Skermanella rosea]|uniref:hypothetical protein n=1 Tax=Skermanella rosea TaxID=1817965 RepID=UPI0019325C1B|nr:hypothetical protein [Skermanella rosea]UEM07147.1 hypothetical protein JL101_029570 [Skermanella rosea]
MHHIFPDHALLRRECDILLAVIGWPERLEDFRRWMADAHPEADIETTCFDYLPFGPLAEIVFDNYDVILRIRFPTEAEARRFEELWPTRGLAAGPYAASWPDRGPTPVTWKPLRPELLRRIAEMGERRKKAAGGSDPA